MALLKSIHSRLLAGSAMDQGADSSEQQKTRPWMPSVLSTSVKTSVLSTLRTSDIPVLPQDRTIGHIHRRIGDSAS